MKFPSQPSWFKDDFLENFSTGKITRKEKRKVQKTQMYHYVMRDAEEHGNIV